MAITPEQFARLIRYADVRGDDFREKRQGVICPLCDDWADGLVNRSSVEAAGLTWEPQEFEDGTVEACMDVWRLVNLDPVIQPDDTICVVPVRRVQVSPFGAGMRQTLVPVHLWCFYVEVINGRRQRGLETFNCEHCERKFMSRTKLDWCHACERPVRQCEQCGESLERDLNLFGSTSRISARSDARYCSGACRVAAHRARKR
jgi:hypothetical protein